MKKKTLGMLQIIIGLITLVLFGLGLVVSMMTGEPALESLIRANPSSLLFGIFALATGRYNIKGSSNQNNSPEE